MITILIALWALGAWAAFWEELDHGDEHWLAAFVRAVLWPLGVVSGLLRRAYSFARGER